jgi:predicted enzyme related to lactoylglutathione lyase
MSLSIKNFKVYVPAKDFEKSKRFYSALGFSMSEGWGGTADFELSGTCFRLQPYYVKDWAENFMVVINVDDVDGWFKRVQEIAGSGEFGKVIASAPEPVGGSRVFEIVDPSGVLLVFVQ